MMDEVQIQAQSLLLSAKLVFFSVSVSPTWRDESSAYAASVRRILNGSIHSSNPALLVRCKRVSTTRQSTRVNRH